MCSLPVNFGNVHKVVPKGIKSELSGAMLHQTGMTDCAVLVDFGTVRTNTRLYENSYSFVVGKPQRLEAHA